MWLMRVKSENYHDAPFSHSSTADTKSSTYVSIDVVRKRLVADAGRAMEDVLESCGRWQIQLEIDPLDSADGWFIVQDTIQWKWQRRWRGRVSIVLMEL